MKLEKSIDPYILNSNQKILEIGCGDGRHLINFSKKYTNFLIGAEYTKELFEGNKGVGVNFVSCDAVHLPFKSNNIDIIYSNSFFEHVYDPEKALKEQYRVLKSSGYLAIFVANLFNPKSFINLFFKYAIKSGFRKGGVKWLLNKRKVEDNIYFRKLNFKTIKQRDEDIRSFFWWKRFLKTSLPSNAIFKLTTSRSDELPYFLRYLLKFFWGRIEIIIKKPQ